MRLRALLALLAVLVLLSPAAAGAAGCSVRLNSTPIDDDPPLCLHSTDDTCYYCTYSQQRGYALCTESPDRTTMYCSWNSPLPYGWPPRY